MPDSLKTSTLTVLVAPLDWGLGHTTRCIPVIRALLAKKCMVLVAGNGIQERIIREEFPGISFLPLEGYNIRYGKSSLSTRLRILGQFPKITRAIGREHEWLQQLIRDRGIDLIISDNRYGIYDKKIPSVLLIHQLQVQTPLGKWGDGLARFVNYRWIRNFLFCWVPDFQESGSLAGRLSHPPQPPPVPIRYIGPLSRMQPMAGPSKKEEGLLIILSGPEPQRSHFENQLIDQLATSHFHATVVRGLPGSASQIPSTNHLHFYNHLPTEELQRRMLEAEFVIARCGYSTVMDLVSLRKRSILIPTPGQTEQEWLARHLHQQGMACCISQDSFELTAAVNQGRSFAYRWPLPESGQSRLEEALEEVLALAGN